jgi:hypothetical protein
MNPAPCGNPRGRSPCGLRPSEPRSGSGITSTPAGARRVPARFGPRLGGRSTPPDAAPEAASGHLDVSRYARVGRYPRMPRGAPTGTLTAARKWPICRAGPGPPRPIWPVSGPRPGGRFAPRDPVPGAASVHVLLSCQACQEIPRNASACPHGCPHAGSPLEPGLMPARVGAPHAPEPGAPPSRARPSHGLALGRDHHWQLPWRVAGVRRGEGEGPIALLKLAEDDPGTAEVNHPRPPQERP